MGEDDNFWPAGAPTHGPNGVCGPCSEIFYHGDGPEGSRDLEPGLHPVQPHRPRPARALAQEEHRYRHGPGTGGGLPAGRRDRSSRSTSSSRSSPPSPRRWASITTRDQHADGVRIRRMADHVRALTFCIHENVRPGPEKQGYVDPPPAPPGRARRLPDGPREPFLHQLVAGRRRGHEAGPIPSSRESVAAIQTTSSRKKSSSSATWKTACGCSTTSSRRPRPAGPTRSPARMRSRCTPPTASRRGRRKPGGRPEPAGRHGRLRGGAGRGTQRSPAARPRPPTSSPPARSTRSSRNITTAASSSATRRPRPTATRHRHPRAEPARRFATRRQRRPANCPGPRPNAVLRRVRRPGRRHGHDPRRPGFVFAVEDTKKDNDFMLHIGQVAEGDRQPERPGRRPTVDADRRAGDPPRPLGDPPAAPRPAPASGQARPAGRQQGRARPAAVRLRQPRGRRPRRLRR